MSVANQLSQDLPIFLLAHFYGIEMAGAYAFGLRILSTPMLFLLRALRQVLYQKASETHHNGGHLLDLFMKITAGLFFVALLPSLLLVIWAPQLFSWIFGSQWQMAGELARSLVLWMLFMFCNVPAVLFARILRLQQKLFLYDLVLLALRVSVLVYGGMYLSVTNTVMLFSVVGSIMNINFIIIIGLALARGEGYSGLSAILSNLKN
jgi:O-antigen/teichoic acid export membrane protein